MAHRMCRSCLCAQQPRPDALTRGGVYPSLFGTEDALVHRLGAVHTRRSCLHASTGCAVRLEGRPAGPVDAPAGAVCCGGELLKHTCAAVLNREQQNERCNFAVLCEGSTHLAEWNSVQVV